MKSHALYYRPDRLGMRKAEATRFAKKLNDAAADGRLVACLTIGGQLAVEADLVRELRAQGKCGRRDGPLRGCWRTSNGPHDPRESPWRWRDSNPRPPEPQ